MIFELWHSAKESSYLFVGRDDRYENTMSAEKESAPDLVLVWTYKATSYFAAMQAYYDYLGYGVYKPEPDWEDIFYE